MANNQASQDRCVDKMAGVCLWLVFVHLVVDGVLAEIYVAAQDPSGRLCSATPLIEWHEASKVDYVGQHGDSRVVIPDWFLDDGQ